MSLHLLGIGGHLSLARFISCSQGLRGGSECASGTVAAVQSLSRVRLFAAPWTAARQASLPFAVSWSLLKLVSVESMMPSNHLILLPSVFPSVGLFSNESALRTRRPKYWSFSISPSNEYSGLISFRVDWLDLLAVLGTLKSLLQHDCFLNNFNSKQGICQSGAFGGDLT